MGMRAGIVSFAHMHAWSYAEALKKTDGVDLTGIYDEDAARGRQAAERFGVRFYPDLNELLQSGVEAVVVASENVRHRDHVLAAAAAGKHVLCEKPLAVDVASAREMVETCREKGVYLGTAFPCRFQPSVERAKQLVDQGAVGRILAIKGTNRGTNPGGWFVDPALSGGGAMMDHTVHVVDLMRWFLRSEVEEVYAEADTLISDLPVEDCGILTLSFENGAFATLDFSWSRNRAYPTWGDVTLEIVGTEGTLSVDAFAQKLHLYGSRSGYKWHPWGDDMDRLMIRSYFDRIRSGLPPLVTGEDGLRAVEAAVGGYESVRLKDKVRVR